ncbi:hypothetical protein ACSVDE_04655 [Pseudalkalibacillus sp. Hm43]|uniref:hypothetical protein n=1 Tax=Pseudalkalibacillus sp. Hm43 TaxID=3450742 RepID=UPI003F434479
MKRFKHFILWFLFLSTFGFAGGGYFLLFLIVPFEEWLVNNGSTQEQIDDILKYFVFGWIAFGFTVSFVYYWFLIRKKKRVRIATVLTIFTTLNAAFVFYLFMNTNSAIVAMSRGEVEQTTEQLTFGPYPDQPLLQDLEQQGYDGVITLLSTTIPFENELLDQEMENGDEVGLTIHSFPMLPWVGDNAQSINGIVELLKSNPDKRYYVHCYLGKHRVDLIKQTIIQRLGEEAASDDGDRRILIQSDFERGHVYTFKNESIILGPYPNEEEWFKLLRLNVKEVVTLLDESSSLYEEEERIAKEQGLKLTAFQLDSDSPDLQQLDQIVQYIQTAGHKIYVHDFKDSHKIRYLELMLDKGIYPIDKKALTDSKGMQLVGESIILGSKPSKTQVEQLKEARIQKIIYLGDDTSNTQSQIHTLLESGMDIEIVQVKKNPTIIELHEIAERLHRLQSQVFVYGLDSKSMGLLQTILEAMNDGLAKDSLHEKMVEQGSLYVKARRLMVGPALNPEEWQSILIRNGVTRVILVHAASVQTEADIEKQVVSANEYGIPIQIIEMTEGYDQKLLNQLSSTDDTTYLIVANELKEMVIKDIKDFR